MSATTLTKALCVCDGAAVPGALNHASWDHRLDITTRGTDAEVNVVVEDLIGKWGGELQPRVQDLLSLAAYCFAADRMVRRGGPIDVHRNRWRRELVLCVPVADPAFWSRPEVMHRLITTLAFGTDDRWCFHFDHLQRTVPQLAITWSERELLEQPDTVVLFSGGTDSLCGVVEAVTRHGARPVLVSHWAADQVKARQRRLRTAVRRALGPWEFPHVQVELHRRAKQDGESSQRTRGFLFACLGAAVAAHLGIKRVLLPENGYVSINPRINDQLVGALASRGTHPKFLAVFNRLLELVFEGTVTVSNPLWDRTRAEALATLQDADCAHLLQQTYSCGKLQGRSPGKSHCGGCSQCIDRRFAVLMADLEEHDPLNHYEFDLFTDALPEGEPRTVALSYVRFAAQLRPLDPVAILDQRRELDMCVDPDDSDADRQFLALADLLRRHAGEVLCVMGQMYSRAGKALANRTLDQDSLLLLWQDRPAARRGDQEVPTFGVEPHPARSRFERAGQVWRIEFRDEKGGLPNRVGARRLARILKAGGQDLEALDLVAETSARSQTSRRAAEPDLRTAIQADAGDVLDEPAIDAYRARLVELDRECKIARAAGDAHTIAECERESGWIKRELKQWIGKYDEPRPFPEEHDRARQTVSKTVWLEVRALGETMPLLRAHLETFLHLGFVCWYAPDPSEPWDVDL
jgi:7-cyano-7-deazaguanine synthase in queuosine biosynthesis